MGADAEAVAPAEDLTKVLVDELRANRALLETMVQLMNPKGITFALVDKLELVAMQQLVVAGRRVRMMKAEGGTLLQLADALTKLDEVLDAREPSQDGRKRPPA